MADNSLFQKEINDLLPRGYVSRRPNALTIPPFVYEIYYEPVKTLAITSTVFRIVCEWSVLDDAMHYKGQLITATPDWQEYNSLEEAVQTLCAMHRLGVT